MPCTTWESAMLAPSILHTRTFSTARVGLAGAGGITARQASATKGARLSLAGKAKLRKANKKLRQKSHTCSLRAGPNKPKNTQNPTNKIKLEYDWSQNKKKKKDSNYILICRIWFFLDSPRMDKSGQVIKGLSSLRRFPLDKLYVPIIMLLPLSRTVSNQSQSW